MGRSEAGTMAGGAMAGLRVWLALVVMCAGCTAVEFVDSEEDDASPIEQRLNLLDMVAGIKPGRIDVGLDWKYGSAVATKYVRAPKVAVGHNDEITSTLHVNSQESKAAALFTGQGKVDVEISSPNLHAALLLAAGKTKWELAVPSSQELRLGKAGANPTLRMTDGKLGINTDAKPTKSLHLQSSEKGDSILFQGNFDSKTDALMDALITLEASADARGRGMFLPHRDRSEGGKTHAWFVGVPSGGEGFTIGSSATHLHESKDGPYAKANSRIFVTPDGRVGVGVTQPAGQLDIQVPADSKKADTAVNIRGGSINVDYGRGVFTAGVATLSGEKGTVILGSAKKEEGREIRLQSGQKSFVVVGKDNGWVGIGGIATPAAPVHLRGDMRIEKGSMHIEAEPKDAQQMVILDSKATVPAAIGFRQGTKPFMSISAGNKGGTIEMANKVDLTIVGGKVGFGTDPTELVHVKGGNVLLDGKSSINFNNIAAGSKIWEDAGLHITSKANGRVFVENSDLEVSNAGSQATMVVKSEASKDSVLKLLSGVSAWNIQTSQAAQSTLIFSQRNPLMALTKDGELGVGLTAPKEKLHVKGNALLERAESPVYATMHTKAEARLAGIRLMSGTTKWRIETQGSAAGQVGAGSLQVVGGDKTHMVISKTGGVGIGLDAPLPGTSLHVKGPAMIDVGKGKGKIVVSTPNLNPGFSFFNNAGTRIVDIEATSAGLAFMRNGFIGMGIREAGSRLHVHDVQNSAITLSRNDKVASTSAWTYNGAFVQFGSTVADGVQFTVSKKPQMTIHPNGKVGVHTEAPQSDLQINTRSHMMQVADATYFAGNAFWDGAKFKYTTNGGAAALKIYDNGKVGIMTAATGNSNMPIATFDQSKLIVTDTGNVGVGTESPDSKLHISTSEEATLAKHGGLMIGQDKLNDNLVMDSKSIQSRKRGRPVPFNINPFGGDLMLFSASDEDQKKTVFTDKGQVGFGTLQPQAKLHVSEGKGKFTTLALGESPKGSAVIRYKSSMLTLGFSKTKEATTNQEDALVVKPNGLVGIGTSAPEGALHVKGDVVISGKLNVGGKPIVALMEELTEENRSLRQELAETKEMMMSMSANLRRMSEMMQASKDLRES